MKRRNYVVIMIVSIVAMVIMPVATCRAGWIVVGNGMSSGAPGSDSDHDSSGSWFWEWSYNVSGGSRGADESGCWAQADMSYHAYVEAWSWGGSESVSVPDDRWIKIYAESYYANIPAMGYRYLDYSLDAYVSGQVVAVGLALINYPEAGSAYSWSRASGDAEAYEYGYGYVDGSVSAGYTGDTWWTVGGEATKDPGSNPYVYEGPGEYIIDLDFTIDIYEGETIDSVGGPSNFTASTEIRVSVDAYASVDINEGIYFGMCYSAADADIDGYCIVDVDLYN